MPFYQLPSGASPVLAGTAPPTGGIGTDGDLFIDTANKTLYGPKAAGVWPTGIDLSQGPSGPTGSVGATGPSVTGPTGSTGGIAFSVGATAPTAPGLTVAGAVWLDESTGRYFVRYETQFIEIGVQGERGATGATGADSNVAGPTGATGATGPDVTGPTGGIAFSVGPTAPTAPSLTVAGAIWLDESNGRYFVRYDSQFIEVGVQGERGPTGPGGDFTDAQSLNPQVTGYTLVLSDAGKLLTFDATGTVEVIVPAASSVAFPTGTHVDIARLNTGDVQVTGATGVTVNATPGSKLRAQYSAGTMILYEGDKWLVVGDLSS